MDCPSCEEKGSFGVAGVNENHYIRKCRACGKARLLELPPLKKRILYIDQFALSGMLKELDAASPRPSRSTRDAFSLDLFGQLDRLGKLMLIVCPYSSLHLTESKAIEKAAETGADESARTEQRSEFGRRFKQIRMLFGHLSFDTAFLHNETIEQRQTLVALEDWLKGGTAFRAELDPSEAISGKVNAWLPTLYPALDSPLDREEVKAIRAAKTNLGAGLDTVVNRWRREDKKSFKDWFGEEVAGHGAALRHAYRQHEPQLKASQSRFGLDRLPCPRNPAAALMVRILQRLEDAGHSGEECRARADEFLASTIFGQIPHVRIGAALWAGMAHRLVHGGQKAMETSFANDVRFLSAYLPYCDAMFIDNACAEMLKKQPVSQVMPESDRVYSMHHRAEFLSFLKSIESAASPEQLTKVAEVYGDNWLPPSNDILTASGRWLENCSRTTFAFAESASTARSGGNGGSWRGITR